jgi:hypothetical protein
MNTDMPSEYFASSNATMPTKGWSGAQPARHGWSLVNADRPTGRSTARR